MVYLVDDDTDDLEIMREALVLNSYKGPVKTAVNGLQFLKDLQRSAVQEKPGVVLLDLNMPLKDGFAVLEEIRRDPSLHSIPVIVVTASSNEKDEIRCFELGCRVFFRKPHQMQGYHIIVTMIKQLMDGD